MLFYNYIYIGPSSLPSVSKRYKELEENNNKHSLFTFEQGSLSRKNLSIYAVHTSR